MLKSQQTFQQTFQQSFYSSVEHPVLLETRVWNGDGVTGDGGDGEVTGDKIFTGDITGDKIVTGEAFSPVKLVLKRDRYAQKSGFFRLVAGTAATYCPSQFFCR